MDLTESRQDRQLMRQRGAGSRTIGNVDFGFTFSTPAARRNRRSRTPHLAHSTSIPEPLISVEKSPARPAASNPIVAIAHGQADFPEDPSIRSTKRRRSNESTEPVSVQDDDVVFVEGNGGKPPDYNGGVNEKGHNDGGRQEQEKENVPPVIKIAVQPRRKRKRVIPASLRPKKRSSTRSSRLSKGSSIADLESESDVTNRTLQEDEALQGLQRPSDSAEGVIDDNSSADASTVQFGGGIRAPLTSINISASKTQNLNRRSHTGRDALLNGVIAISPSGDPLKRDSQTADSSTQLSHGARSQELAPRANPTNKIQDFITVNASPGPSTPSTDEDDVSDTLIESIEVPWSAQKTKISGRYQKEVARDEGDDEEDEDYVEGKTEERYKRRKQRKRTTRHDRRERSESQSKTSMLPVLTHRLGNIEALPTIREESDSDHASNDELQARFHDRTAPNAVDVLSQICREIIASTSEQAPKSKRAALESFGEELDTRLFDMSSAAENRMTLEARVRKSKREAAELQTRWMEVRNQREVVALKCDNIRRRHLINEKEGRRKWNISQLAQDIEVQAGGIEQDQETVEYLLRSVAAHVSKDGASSGLLHTIKDLNTHLERLVNALERH